MTYQTSIARYEMNRCWFCDQTFGSSEPRFDYVVGEYVSRGRNLIRVADVCAPCASQEAAIATAEAAKVRFSRIDPLERCVCGRVRLAILHLCIPCIRDRKMLDQALANARLNERLLRDLRREIREIAT